MIIFVSIPLSHFSTIPSISKLKILSCMESIMQTATSLKEVLQQSRLLEALRYENPCFREDDHDNVFAISIARNACLNSEVEGFTKNTW